MARRANAGRALRRHRKPLTSPRGLGSGSGIPELAGEHVAHPCRKTPSSMSAICAGTPAATFAPSPDQLGLAPVATTLRALLPAAEGLSDGERHLLAEWLDRLARSA